MWSMIFSIIVYGLCSYYFSYFIESYFDKGILKNLIVFIFASFVAWSVANVIDWIFPAQAITLFGDPKLHNIQNTKNIEVQRTQALLEIIAKNSEINKN